MNEIVERPSQVQTHVAQLGASGDHDDVRRLDERRQRRLRRHAHLRHVAGHIGAAVRHGNGDRDVAGERARDLDRTNCRAGHPWSGLIRADDEEARHAERTPAESIANVRSASEPGPPRSPSE